MFSSIRVQTFLAKPGIEPKTIDLSIRSGAMDFKKKIIIKLTGIFCSWKMPNPPECHFLLFSQGKMNVA